MPEVFDHTTTAADNVELHKVGIVFMLSELAKNTCHVLGCRRFDDLQILWGNLSRAEAQNIFDYGVVGNRAELSHKLLSDIKHTLVRAELLGKHIGALRSAIGNKHDVHRAVADVADHIHPAKRAKLSCHRRKALGKDLCTDEIDVKFLTLVNEVHMRFSEKIGFKLVLLLSNPSQRKSRRKIDRRAFQVSRVKLTPNGGKGEDIIVIVVLLFWNELLVSFSDDIIPPVVDKHIACKRRLGIVSFHACPKTRGCRFDVPISVVDADHDGSLIFVYVHNDFSL